MSGERGCQAQNGCLGHKWYIAGEAFLPLIQTTHTSERTRRGEKSQQDTLGNWREMVCCPLDGSWMTLPVIHPARAASRISQL
jgi:hypothetical protein